MGHRNIIQLKAVRLKSPAGIVMEMANEGNLTSWISQQKIKLPWTLTKKGLSICEDITEGMIYLHDRNPPIFHGDLKSSNVLLVFHFGAQLADFDYHIYLVFKIILKDLIILQLWHQN